VAFQNATYKGGKGMRKALDIAAKSIGVIILSPVVVLLGLMVILYWLVKKGVEVIDGLTDRLIPEDEEEDHYIHPRL